MFLGRGDPEVGDREAHPTCQRSPGDKQGEWNAETVSSIQGKKEDRKAGRYIFREGVRSWKNPLLAAELSPVWSWQASDRGQGDPWRPQCGPYCLSFSSKSGRREHRPWSRSALRDCHDARTGVWGVTDTRVGIGWSWSKGRVSVWTRESDCHSAEVGQSPASLGWYEGAFQKGELLRWPRGRYKPV